MTQLPRKILQYSDVFELFPVHIRNAIYATAIHKEFRQGEYVFKNGDQEKFLACVVAGRLRMGLGHLKGKEMIVTMVERGELFGEMSILDDMPRAVDVMAETDCTLMIIKRDDFLPVLRTNPDVMLALVRITCYRMRLYLQTMEMIALQNLTIRLGRYLLQLAQDYGKMEDGKTVIKARLSQTEMGQQLAASRESINKQLHEFVEKGYLSLHGTDIVLLDIEGLKQAVAYVRD